MAENLEVSINSKLEKIIKKNMFIYFTGSLVSLLGTYMYNFAIGLYVLQLTGSGTSFAISILFGMVPRIILSPFAGAFADKFDRKKMTVMMDILSGILLLCVFIYAQYMTLSLLTVYFSSATLTILNTFFSVSINSSIPNLVDEERLVKINSLMATVGSGTRIAGPLLGGVVYNLIGIEYFLLLNGISFVVSGISELFMNFNIHNRKVNEKAKKMSIIHSLKEGFLYLKQHELILGILKYALFLNFIMSSINITLPYTSVEVLKATPSQYGLIQMGFPLGILIMSIIYSMKKNQKKQVFRNMAKSMFLFGGSFILLALPSNPILSQLSNELHMLIIFIVSLVLGSIAIMINIPIQVLIQKSIDDEYRGRVNGVISMMSQMIAPLGIITFGFLIDHISSYIIPFISGILVLLIWLIMINDKKMLKL